MSGPRPPSLPFPKPKRKSTQQRIARWLLLILILLSIWLIPPILERNQAVEVGVNLSPDLKQKIVIYQVPKVFGSAQDHAAHVVLRDEAGKELRRLRLSHIQDLNNIRWEDDVVIINDVRWSR